MENPKTSSYKGHDLVLSDQKKNPLCIQKNCSVFLELPLNFSLLHNNYIIEVKIIGRQEKIPKSMANKPRHDSDSSEAHHFLSGYELMLLCIMYIYNCTYILYYVGI